MAHFRILREVRTSNPGSWELCFQYGIYLYEPEDDTTESEEAGYRFIWRRPNGKLQGARGQARLEPDLITILLGKAAEEGWYPNPPTHLTKEKYPTVLVDGIHWRISIQLPIAVAARAPGDALPEVPESGLSFRAGSRRRFLNLAHMDLPTRQELLSASNDDLRLLFDRAEES